MKRLANRYIRIMEWLLPSPFAIAILLTLLTACLALLITEPTGQDRHVIQLFKNWEAGIWGLLTFTMQMMLILVLGHTLALSKPVNRIMRWFLRFCTNNFRTAVIITFTAVLAGYVNWGLGLIFGAIMVRKAGEYAQEKGISVNYPLLGACGYTALMVWHGGFSGSATLDVATTGHNLESVTGIIDPSRTFLSSMNLYTFGIVIILLPMFAGILAMRKGYRKVHIKPQKVKKSSKEDLVGTDVLDHSRWFGWLFGLILLVAVVIKFSGVEKYTRFFTLDNVNLILFSLAVLAHGSLDKFSNAVGQAIKGSTGIMIQFPLYAGIMGIMHHSGLLAAFAGFFIEISNGQTFPVFAFTSSAIVNLLVPSGGGQWQVQGPILIEAAQSLKYPLDRTVMCLAYGDQLTNMLQPFWALPLLGITGLKAKDILPYSTLFMLLGAAIYLFALLVL